ncbi:hypothetical protein DPSP01_013128 [Paraphaeosphaeria sporulosa]
MASRAEKLPPRAKISSKFKRGFANLAENQEKIAIIRENAQKSKFFDGSAPSTRKKREQARALFEAFVEATNEDLGPEDASMIWRNDCFIQRSKEFLEGLLNVSKGKFSEKIQAHTLYGYKHALYWWACVLVDDFRLIWHAWHVEIIRHVHYLAVNEGLSNERWQKNNLSDGELALIFQQIMDQRYDVPNLKQHWAAILLAWTTAARPSSFAVAVGYEKGASLGIPGKFRADDETLRWSDVNFVHAKGGIAVQVTFRFHKGYRNPLQEKSKDASRTFIFLPTRAERLEFDLALILLGLAVERGLFVSSIEDILAGGDGGVFVEKHTHIARQAVFVAAKQNGDIDPEKPMNTRALNDKLQKLCASIGLIERNTYYSLRRTAIIETRRKEGKLSAQDLAGHVPTANSLVFYDNMGFGDLDLTRFRLRKDSGEVLTGNEMSREELRDFFSQKNIARIQPETGSEGPRKTFKEQVEETANARLRESEEYAATELALNQILDDIETKLLEMQRDGEMEQHIHIPRGYFAHKTSRYLELAQEFGLNDIAEKLQDHLKHRKARYKVMRYEFQKAFQKEVREKHRAMMKEGNTQSKRPFGGRGIGFVPELAKDATVPRLGDIEVDPEAIREAEEEEPEREEEASEPAIDVGEDLEEAFCEDHDLAGPQEPECWEGLDETVHIAVGHKGKEDYDKWSPDEDYNEWRNRFLMQWIDKRDLIVPKANLHCPRCQTDPTMPEKAKARTYSRFDLNRHMAGGTHTRDAQLRRALKMDGLDTKSLIVCPDCKALCKGTRKFMIHVEDFHTEQLWLDLEDEEPTDFEGFSDRAFEQGLSDPGPSSEWPGASSWNGFSEDQPEPETETEPQYTGKGKGRVLD